MRDRRQILARTKRGYVEMLLSVGMHKIFDGFYNFSHSGPVLVFVCPHAFYKVYNFGTPLFA